MKITPADGRILVRLATETVTPPPAVDTVPCKVRVVAVGAGQPPKTATPFEVKIGDDVLINQRAGVRVTLAKTKYSVIRPADVIGLINPEPAT
jgi:co-chaperonin GroES (HSP10)